MRRTLALSLGFTLCLAGGAAAQDSTAALDDVELRYELTGEGPPLVLIHGWTHDLRTWDLQVSALRRHFTVLRYDRRGWGQSGGHPDVSRDPADLDRLMAELGLDSAIVLGHSQGAHVALRFALAHPERVTALGLYGSPPPEGFGLPWTGRDTLPSNMPEIVDEAGVDSLAAILFSHPLARGFREGRPGSRLAGRMWATNAGRGLRDPRPPSGATPPPRTDRLGEIGVPALVLTGERELRYFRVVADALAYGIQGAERIVVQGGGHAVHLQEPERFTAEVLRFFGGLGAR